MGRDLAGSRLTLNAAEGPETAKKLEFSAEDDQFLWKKKRIQSALSRLKRMRSCAGGDMCTALHSRKLTEGLYLTDILIR